MTTSRSGRDPAPSDDQLAAWLAGDLDHADDTRITDLVAADPDLAQRVDRLVETLAALAQAVAPAPPADFATRLETGITTGIAEGVTRVPSRVVRPRPAWLARRSVRAGGRRLDRLTGSLAVLLVLGVTAGLGVTFFRSADSAPPARVPEGGVPSAQDGDEVQSDQTSTGVAGGTAGGSGPAPTEQPSPGAAAGDAAGTGAGARPAEGSGIDGASSGDGGAGDVAEDAGGGDGGGGAGDGGGGDGGGAGQADADAGDGGVAAPITGSGDDEEVDEAAGDPAPAEEPQPGPVASGDPPSSETPDTPIPATAGPSPPQPATPDPVTPGEEEPPEEDSGGPAPPPVAADATSVRVLDSEASLADVGAVTARYGGRPEVTAQLGLEADDARARGATHLAQLQTAGPLADGTQPGRCSSVAAASGDPSVIVVVETIVYGGQPALAHLVVTGSPTLDRVVVVVTDRTSCRVLLDLAL